MINFRFSLFKQLIRSPLSRATPRYWASTESLASKELKTQEVPVHLRPYDKTKYEVPSSKIKVPLFIEK